MSVNGTILDLCGGSGAWSRPYREAGYTVDLITLPAYDVTRVEFGNHAMDFERMDKHYHETHTVMYCDIVGILAAPPCTEFSLAKGNAPRDFKEGMKIVKACLEIIWQCRTNGNLKFWALENPRGFLRQFLGKPHFNFEHWHYDSNAQFVKSTDVWGYFNAPKQANFEKPKLEYSPSHGKLYSNPACPKQHAEYVQSLPCNQRRAAIRAITPSGFAEAFYRVNK